MHDELIEQTKAVLSEVQNYDLNRLARKDLGGMDFGVAVAPAQRLISLFGMLPLEGIKDLPKPSLDGVKSEAEQVRGRFNEFASFDLANFNGNVMQWRDSKTNELRDVYDTHAQRLIQPIAFLSAKRTDFSALQTQARQAIDSIGTERTALLAELQQAKADAEAIRDAMKRAAADVGVTQEATHFATQATMHETNAGKWLIASFVLAVITGLYAVLSLFITRIPFLTPQNEYEMVQLVVSKILVFAVIAYMLVMSVRNYAAQKHNGVVNKHRQNALQTYKALASAAHIPEAQDIVLTHAAACIYSPQETGYTKASNSSAPSGLIEMLPRLANTPAPHT